MKNAVRSFLPAVAVVAMMTSLAAPAAADAHDMQVIELSIQEEVQTPPDIATIQAGVVTTEATAAAALRANAERMNAVHAALKKAGVEDRDMQTSGISLHAQYDYRDNQAGPRLTGYQASNTLNITVRDLKNLGGSLDTLVASGANQINGPTFSVDKPEELLDRARAAAVKKAQHRANLYAAAAGLRVKKLLGISETSAANPPMPFPVMKARAMSAQMESATPVAPGEVSLGVNILVRYEIGQ